MSAKKLSDPFNFPEENNIEDPDPLGVNSKPVLSSVEWIECQIYLGKYNLAGVLYGDYRITC